MGTTITVQPLAALQIVQEMFEQTELEMSEWKEDSPLACINLNSGIKPVEVPQDLFHALERSLDIAEMTSGAFDPTWASLWKLWKFDGSDIVPTQTQVDALLPSVNWEHVILDQEKNSVYLPFGNIGLGGIAKGVALDKARKALLQNGFKDFMIVAGGQVLVHGSKNGKPWRVGIRDPEKTQYDFIGILELSDTCVSTSGNYEKFFLKDGIRYHHIIDPKTGFPSEGVQSVTVISSDATLADALSTALFVMGYEKALDLVNSMPNVEAILIDSDHQLLLSKNIQDRLTLVSDSHSLE